MITRCVYVGSADDHARKFTCGGYEGRGLYNKKTGWPIDMPQRDELCAPLIMADVSEHVAPDGTVVSSKSTRREVCKRNGWEPREKVIQHNERETRPTGYVNPTFAKKRGLKLCDKAQQWHHNRRRRQAQLAGL